MIHQDDIIKAVEVIMHDIISIIDSIAQDDVEGEVFCEIDSIELFLNRFEQLIFVDRITKKYGVDIELLINNEAEKLPIRYLACYLLLNSQSEVKNENRIL